MNDYNSSPTSSNRSRWTEDRVERLLLAMFAEQPVVTPVTTKTEPTKRSRNAALVFVAAACLAMIVPMLSISFDGNEASESSRLARWIGPKPRPQAPSVDLALSDEVELADESADVPSVGESDETAEAPSTTESEDSAST